MIAREIPRYWFTAIAALMILAGSLVILSTDARLSRTADETYHTFCGMEWWEKGTYTREPKHSPLARIFEAAPFYFLKISPTDFRNTVFGLSPRDSYIYRTWLTRLGVLPFYVISCMAVFCWSRQLFGMAAGVSSLALYVTLASIAGNSGVATTDMAYTAMFVCAMMASIAWLKMPDAVHSAWLGAGVGLMVGAKFSGLVQWPAAMVLILVAQGVSNYRSGLPAFPITRKHALNACLVALPAMAASLLVVYHFSYRPLWQGVVDLHHANAAGFAIWLFKPLHNRGVWYFFPVVFFFKTPISFHLAAALGNADIIRKIKGHGAIEPLFPLLAAFGALVASMPTNINMGVRHVLVLYPLLAVPAGYGLVWLWHSWGSIGKAIMALLLLWQAGNFVQAYPDFISYYNELGGRHPEHISLDSDFDWGQGIIQLDAALQRRGIHEVYACARKLNIVSHNLALLLHTRALDCPTHSVTGWVAVSRTEHLLRRNDFAWLEGYKPVELVGKTIDLYYIPAP